jgi:hypothetical protein
MLFKNELEQACLKIKTVTVNGERRTWLCMYLSGITIYLYSIFLKEFCADIISVLGMTISDKRECLKYRFLSSKELVGSWGHEYAR